MYLRVYVHMCVPARDTVKFVHDIVVPQGLQHCMLKFHVTIETWVLVFSPEGSTTMEQEDHLHKGKGYPVGSDCVIGFLPDHKGKIAVC